MEEDNFSLITDVLVTSTVLLLGTPGGLLLYAPSTGRNPPPMLLLGKRRVPGGVGRLSSFQDGSLIVAQSYQEKNTVLVLDLSASTTPHPDEEDFSVLVLAKKTFKSEILAVNFSEDCMVVITAPIPHHNNDENNNLKSSTHARVHILANSNDYPHRLERLFWFHCHDKGASSSLQDLLVFPSSYDVLFSRDDRDNMVSHKCSRVVFPAEKKDAFTVMTVMSDYPHSPALNQKKNPTSFAFQSSPPYPASSTGESLSLRCMQLNALGNKVITIDREEGKNIHLWAVVHHAPQDSIVYVGALPRGQTHAAQDCVSLSITSMPLSYPRENQNNINNNNSSSVFIHTEASREVIACMTNTATLHVFVCDVIITIDNNNNNKEIKRECVILHHLQNKVLYDSFEQLYNKKNLWFQLRIPCVLFEKKENDNNNNTETTVIPLFVYRSNRLKYDEKSFSVFHILLENSKQSNENVSVLLEYEKTHFWE